jgi:tight adherence protein C
MPIRLIAALAGIALFIAILGLENLVAGSERRKVAKRMQRIRGEVDEAEENAVHYIGNKPLPLVLKWIAFLGYVLPHLLTSESLEWDLIQAGYRRPDSNRVFAGLKVLCAVFFWVGTLLGGAYIVHSRGYLLLLSATMGVAGYFLPTFWLAWKRANRVDEITHALPDALDLMVICVEAGQGLNAAMVSVGREIEMQCRALAEELRLVNHEMRIGQSRGQALRNFALRTGVDEVRALAAVLIQSDRLGTSIGKALRVHAQSMRGRRRQRAEEAARKTAVKLVFPLVLFIFPELLVVILAPAVIQIVRALGQSG